jgi:hypothetical protein
LLVACGFYAVAKGLLCSQTEGSVTAKGYALANTDTFDKLFLEDTVMICCLEGIDYRI